jgi:CSLREA domain-containing protein
MLRRAVLAIVMLAWLPAAASATTLRTVTTTTDSDDGSCTASVCSLRDAITYSSAGDTIDLPAGHYTLTRGDLVLNHGVVLGSIAGGMPAGAASTTIDGGGNDRVLTVKAGTSSFMGVSIVGGNAQSTLASGGNDGVGGAVWVDTGATLTLDQSAVLNSTATVSGGGIDVNGTLNLDAATVADDHVTAGLGIGGGVDDFGNVTAINSTIANNTASGRGGGIFNGATLTTFSTTIAGNAAGALADGGGVANDGSVASNGGWTAIGTLLSGNTEGGTTQNNCSGSGTLTDDGYNLDSGTSCGLAGTGDLSSTNPLLGPLQVNSPGQVATMALGTGSPAIDAESTLICQPTDERGAARTSGANCDIGAYDTDNDNGGGGGPAAGLLTQLSGAAGCRSSSAPAPDGCAAGDGVAGTSYVGAVEAPDGSSVYALAVPPGGGVEVFRYTRAGDGSLMPAQCFSSGTSSGCTALRGMSGDATAIAIAPDGKTVYAAGDGSIAILHIGGNGSIGQPSGAPGCINRTATDATGVAHSCTGDGLGAKFDTNWLTVSPDGAELYTGGGLISVLTISSPSSTTPGALSSRTGTGGCVGTGGPNCAQPSGTGATTGLAIAADGRFAYVADASGTLDLYTRSATGALSPAGCISDADNSAGVSACGGTAARALAAPDAVVASPDGGSLYVASNVAGGEVARFDLDASSGMPSQPSGSAGCASADGSDHESSAGSCVAAPGLDGAAALWISPDAQTLYVGAGAAAVLGRGPDGTLTAPTGTDACHAAAANTFGCAEDRGAPGAFTGITGDDGFVYGAAGSALLGWSRATTLQTAYATASNGTRGSVAASSAASSALCGAGECRVPSGGAVQFVATPANGYLFSSWTGACAGQGATCQTSSVTSTVASTAVFLPPVPTSTVLPQIQNATKLWDDATVTTGTWTSAPTSYTYVWEICDASGGSCTDTTTQVNERVMTRDFSGHTARVRVIAHNDGGDSAAVQTAPTAVIHGAPQVSIKDIGQSATAASIDLNVDPAGGLTTITASVKADDGSVGTVQGVTVPATAAPGTVTMNVTGLLPSTTYHVTVNASNGYGTAPLPEDPCCLAKDFTTDKSGAVTSAEPGSITASSTTLVGDFDPVFFTESQTQDCAGGSGNGFGNCGLQAACLQWNANCFPYYQAYQQADFELRRVSGNQTVTDIPATSASPLGGSIPGSAGQGGRDPFTGLYMDYAAFVGYATPSSLQAGTSYEFRAHYAASCLPQAYGSCDPPSNGSNLEIKNLYGDWRTFTTSTASSSSTGSYRTGVILTTLGCAIASGCVGTGAATTIVNPVTIGPVSGDPSFLLSGLQGAAHTAAVQPRKTATKAKAITLGRFTFSIPGHHRAHIRIKVSKAGRRYLRAHKRAVVLLTISVRSPGHKRITTSSPLRLSG